MKHTSQGMLSAMLVAGAILWWASPCGADDQARGKLKAKEGIEFVQKENYPAALAAFEEAYRLYPKPKLLYNIAMCKKALYRYVEAIEAFERFLEQGGKEIQPAMRKDAEDAIREMERLIGRLRIENAPEGVKVLIDGKEVNRTDPQGLLLLDPGEHALSVSKDGYEPMSTEVTIRSNAEVIVRPVLVPKQAPAEPGDKPEPQPMPGPVLDDSPSAPQDKGDRKGLKVLSWILVGVGAATLAGGAITGAMTASLKSDIDEACGNDDCSTEEWQDDVDRSDKLALTTNVLLIGGGAVAAAGAVMLFFSYRSEPEEEKGVALAPFAGPGLAGMSVQGRF